jgi:hypothetical protein
VDFRGSRAWIQGLGLKNPTAFELPHLNGVS